MLSQMQTQMVILMQMLNQMPTAMLYHPSMVMVNLMVFMVVINHLIMELVIIVAMAYDMGMIIAGIQVMVIDTVPGGVTARPTAPTTRTITITTSAVSTTAMTHAVSTVVAIGTAIGMANQLQVGWQEKIFGYLEPMFNLLFSPGHTVVSI